MTRDGLVVENQADGTVENVSSREAEQDYSTDSEGKTEKILERTEDVKDKHKAKKKAKQAAETTESEDGLHRSAARLELTEEERADPALQPYIQKAEAKADKLDAARAALPKKRVPVKEKVYDAANGKAKSTLRFEQQDKGPPSLKPNPASRPLSESCQKWGRMAESPRGPARAGGIPGAFPSRAGSFARFGQHPAACSA